MSNENYELGDKLYRALAARDVETLTAMMHPDFIGDLTPGLPLGLGRKFEGWDVMHQDYWGVIDEHFEMQARVRQLLASSSMIMAYGDYRGTAKATGKQIYARFAHVWPVHDGIIMGMHQTTDSAAWNEALVP